MTLITISQLKKYYDEPDGRRLTVLDIEHWQLDPGEQVALLGRSGSGKTTLLHIMAGLTLPTSGRIEVAGQNLSELSEEARDRFRAETIGYIHQALNLLSGFTALENVLLGMTFGGKRPDEARARTLLDRVGLGHRLDHRPAALSAGERQRVAIARALLAKPKVLLADEPTAHLDPINQEQVINLIRSTCQDEGVALLIVTHAPEVSEQFDRVESIESFNRVTATLKGVSA